MLPRQFQGRELRWLQRRNEHARGISLGRCASTDAYQAYQAAALPTSEEAWGGASGELTRLLNDYERVRIRDVGTGS